MFYSSFNRPRNEVRYTLVITFPDGDIHSFPVGDSAITIGRSPATAIRVPEDGVSRQHCVVSPAGGRLIVLDQGSTNGTYVNGALVRQARLSDGDVIQVGSTRIRVQARSVEESEPLRPTTPAESFDEDDVTTETFEVPVGTEHLVQRLAERLASSDGAVSAAELVLDVVTDTIPVDRAFIITGSPERRGAGAEVLASRSRTSSEATGELDLEIPVIVLETLAADPHLVSAAETTAAIRAALSDRTSGPVLCAPMRHGGEAFGAIYLDALTLPEWAQSAKMLGFLSSVGALAALAISRARLHAELKLEQRMAKRRRERETSAVADNEGASRREAEALRRQRTATAAAALSFLREVEPIIENLDEQLALVERRLDGDMAELHDLVEAASKLGEVVDAVADVGALVELEAGTKKMHSEALDGAALLERVVRRLEPLAKELGVGLMLGMVDDHLAVLGDRALLGRVLHHLVKHSIVVAGQGGRVVLSGHRRAANVELMVADTGQGVPPSQAASFFSLDREPRGVDRPGGVELYFCELAVHAQRGTIRITGPTGNNRIVVTLPVAER